MNRAAQALDRLRAKVKPHFIFAGKDFSTFKIIRFAEEMKDPIAVAMGKKGKGKLKTLSAAALAQRRAASRAAAKARKALNREKPAKPCQKPQ